MSHYRFDPSRLIWLARSPNDEGGGHWITIGSDRDEHGNAHGGGAHVFINGEGRIEKGPGGLAGKKVGELGKRGHSEEEHPRTHGGKFHPKQTHAFNKDSGKWEPIEHPGEVKPERPYVPNLVHKSAPQEVKPDAPVVPHADPGAVRAHAAREQQAKVLAGQEKEKTATKPQSRESSIAARDEHNEQMGKVGTKVTATEGTEGGKTGTILAAEKDRFGNPTFTIRYPDGGEYKTTDLRQWTDRDHEAAAADYHKQAAADYRKSAGPLRAIGRHADAEDAERRAIEHDKKAGNATEVPKPQTNADKEIARDKARLQRSRDLRYEKEARARGGEEAVQKLRADLAKIRSAPIVNRDKVAVPSGGSLRNAPLPDFAKKVQGLADAHPVGFGENKVFIHHIADEAQKLDPSMDRETFKKRVVEAHQAGHLTLSRFDLPSAGHPDDVVASNTKHLNASFNFIMTPPTKRQGIREGTPEAPAPKGNDRASRVRRGEAADHEMTRDEYRQRQLAPDPSKAPASLRDQVDAEHAAKVKAARVGGETIHADVAKDYPDGGGKSYPATPAGLTDERWHAHVDSLIVKAKAYDESHGNTIRDVTPAGYGPDESSDVRSGTSYDSNRQMTHDEMRLKNSINEGETILRGNIAGEKREALRQSVERSKAKLDELTTNNNIRFRDNHDRGVSPHPTSVPTGLQAGETPREAAKRHQESIRAENPQISSQAAWVHANRKVAADMFGRAQPSPETQSAWNEHVKHASDAELKTYSLGGNGFGLPGEHKAAAMNAAKAETTARMTGSSAAPKGEYRTRPIAPHMTGSGATHEVLDSAGKRVGAFPNAAVAAEGLKKHGDRRDDLENVGDILRQSGHRRHTEGLDEGFSVKPHAEGVVIQHHSGNATTAGLNRNDIERTLRKSGFDVRQDAAQGVVVKGKAQAAPAAAAKPVSAADALRAKIAAKYGNKEYAHPTADSVHAALTKAGHEQHGGDFGHEGFSVSPHENGFNVKFQSPNSNPAVHRSKKLEYARALEDAGFSAELNDVTGALHVRRKGGALKLSRYFDTAENTWKTGRVKQELPDVLQFSMSAAEGSESPALGDNRPREIDGQPVVYRWKPMVSPGEIHLPDWRGGVVVKLSRDDLAMAHKCTKDWMRDEGGKPFVPTKHKDFDAKDNMGYIVETKLDDSNTLWGLHQLIGDDARKAAARNETSVQLRRNFKSKSGKVYPWIVEHNTLCPDPVVTGLGRFEAA